MYSSRLEIPPDAAGLDVDDAARAECDRLLCDAHRDDRFVQADRRSHGLRQLGVPEQVVLGKRLLDEQQAELVEFGEVRGVVDGVGGVRIHLEGDVAELLAYRAHGNDVVAGLDLQLDAAVALGEMAIDRLQEIADLLVDPHRNAAVDGGARRAEILAERRAAGSQVGVEDRHLDRSLRHRVAADGRKDLRDVLGRRRRGARRGGGGDSGA